MAITITSSPDTDRIYKGDDHATGDAVGLIWLVLLQAIGQEQADSLKISSSIVPAVKSVAPASDQNDFDAGSGSVLQFGAALGFNLTGIANGVNGKILFIYNGGAGTVTMKHNSGSSASGNKLIMAASADKAVAQGKGIIFIYLNSQWNEFSLA